ncbi:hypothetical protein BG006_009719 [Podila minutissima]|uniref:Uncharacterized protein n=1 Tax=Podila minutissima TaxID=64525 RepID=A0A9P5SI88_9FUNG|nr:hypothetical protein BG006_009719 [Podila minutissima]
MLEPATANDLPVVDSNSIFCEALLKLKLTMKTVHIWSYEASEAQFRNASRILPSYLNLTTFNFASKSKPALPEAVLALFENHGTVRF